MALSIALILGFYDRFLDALHDLFGRDLRLDHFADHGRVSACHTGRELAPPAGPLRAAGA